MSKKLLSERQLRRFAKLACLPAINEWGGRKDDEEGTRGPGLDYVQEQDEEAEIAELGAEEGGGLPEPDEAELDDMAGDELGGEDEELGGADLAAREELAMDVIAAVADVLNIEVDIEGGEGEAGGEEIEDLGVEDELDVGAGEGEEEEVSFDAEEEIMEALRGIKYIPGKKEVVNEVARRVARRLLKAKKANVALKEALGTGPRKQPARKPRRITKTTTSRKRVRPTRASRRRTKK